MRAHVIDNGIVVNTVEVAALDVLPGLVAAQGNEGIGWSYDGHAFTAPAPDLTALRAAHWEAIKADRDKRIQTGGYQASGKWFHSDTFSRTQQMGLVMMGASIPGGLQWKTMDGSFVTMTQTLAGQVFAAAAASDAAMFSHAEQIKAVMEADPVNFSLASQTWPAVFGE
jgi:hypothetical protein